MPMPSLRSATLFIDVEVWDPIHIATKAFELLERLRRGFREAGVEPWTWRVVLPPLPQGVSSGGVRQLAEVMTRTLGSSTLLHLYSLEWGHEQAWTVVDILAQHGNVYASVRCPSTQCIPDVVKNLYGRRLDPEVFTRVSLTLGPWIQTPYFPSTTNVGKVTGFAVSFRYVDLFEQLFQLKRGDVITDYLGRVGKALRTVERVSGIPLLGADYSLSPWMSESVGFLIESLMEDTLPAPGMFAAVAGINRVIREVASSSEIKPMGFNEVMLPVAEDDVLKERSGTGALRVHHLVALSAVCVAGLDMVVVKRDPEVIAKLISDMLAMQQLKMRSLGVRIVPIDRAKPGDWVELGKFGKVPVSYF